MHAVLRFFFFYKKQHGFARVGVCADVTVIETVICFSELTNLIRNFFVFGADLGCGKIIVIIRRRRDTTTTKHIYH